MRIPDDTRPTIFGRSRLFCRLLLLPIAAALLITGLAGCDELLSVEPPDQIIEETLEDPSRASLRVDGAVSAFECAFNAYIQMGGLIGNELAETSLTAARWPYDRRDFESSSFVYGELGCTSFGGLGVYTPLSGARFQADNTLESLRGWTDEQVANRQTLIATTAAHSGYSHLLLGEGFCQVAIDTSEALGSQEVFARAEERFTAAIEAAQAASAEEILNLARVGQARTRLNMGNLDAAAQDAAQVPEGFTYNVTASGTATRRENRIYVENNLDHDLSIEVPYRELTFEGVTDPRVPVVDEGMVADNDVTPLFEQRKYSSRGSPLPLATWEEAQLIRAEAALDNDPQQTVDLINSLHAQADLPDFESSDPAEIRDQLIEERKRELFLESHHLWDLRRFDIPLHPAPGTQFPQGGQYEDNVCLPLPDIERFNNPNIPDN